MSGERGIRWGASLSLPRGRCQMKTNETLPISFLHCAPICEQTPTWVQCKKTAEIKLSRLPSFGGERGIRTHGTQSVQRFSRPPRSTTPASLQSISAIRLPNCDCKIINFLCFCQLYFKKSSKTFA